jgi:signal transduction histidine kinase
MDAAELLSLLIGSLQLAFSLVVIRRLGRYGRAFPWLAALTAFFALRGLMRIYAAFAGGAPEMLALPVDVLLLVALVLLIAGVDRTARGLTLAVNEAHYREEEYRRALIDYRRLARHRLANPLTAIRGGVAVLRTLPLESSERQAILESIDRESRRLERIALDPKPETPEERNLNPKPRLRATGTDD